MERMVGEGEGEKEGKREIKREILLLCADVKLNQGEKRVIESKGLKN